MFEQELAFAHEVADRAAEISMSYFLGEFEVSHKPDLSPVTQADLDVETVIRDMIADRYPADAVTGEEHGEGAGDRIWIVDPIDGTRSFASGVPLYGVLLADYFLLGRRAHSDRDLFPVGGTGGRIRASALAAWLVGFAVYHWCGALAPSWWMGGFEAAVRAVGLPYPLFGGEAGASLPAFAAAALAHVGLGRLHRSRGAIGESTSVRAPRHPPFR